MADLVGDARLPVEDGVMVISLWSHAVPDGFVARLTATTPGGGWRVDVAGGTDELLQQVARWLDGFLSTKPDGTNNGVEP